jgi:hypothetical protein
VDGQLNDGRSNANHVGSFHRVRGGEVETLSSWQAEFLIQGLANQPMAEAIGGGLLVNHSGHGGLFESCHGGSLPQAHEGFEMLEREALPQDSGALKRAVRLRSQP